MPKLAKLEIKDKVTQIHNACHHAIANKVSWYDFRRIVVFEVEDIITRELSRDIIRRHLYG